MKRAGWSACLMVGVFLPMACDEGSPDSDVLALAQVEGVNGGSLGSVAVPMSCSEAAGEHLRRGVALLHNMTYTEADTEFQAALDQDPTCALAYWGRAMSFVHPLWPDVPSDQNFEEGSALLAEARTHGALGGREEAYVSALEAYYEDWGERGESARLNSFFEGWERALGLYPDDPEIHLFRALLLTAVAGGSDDRIARQIEAGDAAEAVLAEIPDHTGALHYIIHAYDLPELADRALPAARIYGELAARNQHALHMTSHIFTRVGSWEESITYNQKSAEAALDHPIDGQTSFHYFHAADYLVYASLQRLDLDAARQVWGDMAAIDGPIFDHPASSYAFAAVPSRVALERGDWHEAAGIRSRWPSTIPWDRYPQFEAIAEFARGLGAARIGDTSGAEAALAKLAGLQRSAAALPIAYDWGTQVRIQEVTVRAWLAYARGDSDQALALMREANALEATTRKNPVTPGEVLPAAELLGDMLFELGQYDEAGAAYASALKRSPRRLNSLYGAARSAEAAGDTESARSFYTEVVDGAIAAAEDDRLEHARRFLASE